jgi:hypothetical protein
MNKIIEIMGFKYKNRGREPGEYILLLPSSIGRKDYDGKNRTKIKTKIRYPIKIKKRREE